MVIKADGEKLIVVISALGNQGVSLIDALQASSKSYRVRGVTRNTIKPECKEMEARGVEMVQGDYSKKETLVEAFKGADIVFVSF